jgi:3-hydroxyisobutyrate dehydrogenase-like beta-hydroxyacid dehydrogenase
MIEKIGVLHPGKMGISIAASLVNSGHDVYWSSYGRSQETRKRAERQKLIELRTLDDLCQTCTIIFSVCPPHAAEELASKVIAAGFKGIYVDANAISPQKANRIGWMMAEVGVDFVDGGIIGGPAWEPGKTWLYLSGIGADRVGAYFSNGTLETEVIDAEIGKASALKMCFAAYTKGCSALLCAILASSEELAVRDVLERQWSRAGSGFADEAQTRVRRVTAKAWRFAGEMDEIAETFKGVGIPNGFHLAAGDIFKRIAHFKDLDELPPLEDILASILKR